MQYTVLLADDEPSLRLLVKASLKDKPLYLVEAVDGREALDLAYRIKPNLILLDVMMPHLTGFQVFSELKSNPEFSHIPIVILTAKGGHEDKEIAHNSGANFFMTKPFRPSELVKVVEYMLYRYYIMPSSPNISSSSL